MNCRIPIDTASYDGKIVSNWVSCVSVCVWGWGGEVLKSSAFDGRYAWERSTIMMEILNRTCGRQHEWIPFYIYKTNDPALLNLFSSNFVNLDLLNEHY